MKNFNIAMLIVFGFLGLAMLSSCQLEEQMEDMSSGGADYVSFVENDTNPKPKLDVFIDGKYFTSYLYADSILRKPVLFPLLTASEQRVTRGFPITTHPGERTDHPHHHGLWFNHGVVNGVDYWNSAVIPKKSDGRYGRINHVKFLKVEPGDTGTLEVEKQWRSDTDELILKERTRYIFSGDESRRVITHITSITAQGSDVLFEDSKEGLFALRVRRELEVASGKSASGASGKYQNSNGLTGYPEVWGKRAKWMELAGEVGGEPLSISIFDHPDNLNHPPHWMARDYGLFAVNSLGSKAFTNGKEVLNFTLKRGESVTFKNQVLITDSAHPTSENIEHLYKGFVAEY